VLNQRDISLECVVSDDSATDDIAEFTARLGDTRIVYCRNAPAMGAPENWNRALKPATGTYVTLLHQDDFYLSEHALKAVCGVFERERADVVFCGRALYADGQRLGEYPLSGKTVLEFQKNFPCGSLVVNRLGPPGVAFFRNAHRCVRYDAALLYFSDTEYFRRLMLTGRTCVCSLALVAVSRSDAQISAGCLRRPDALVSELAYALRKSGAGTLRTGPALARFFAATLRSWRKSTLVAALRKVREEFSLTVCCIFIVSFPVFFMHMLYRAAYRQATGKPWG
jgi:glycosyltransferase involved in cell wall biosynthesis